MTDAVLEAALAHVLGIFGGSAGPGSVSFAGVGLPIWGSWDVVCPLKSDPP